MKGHLTKGQLIQYQFKLVSDIYLEEIAGHLQACAECRRHLEQLRRKFAALDLLREDVRASQDLISRVIEQAAEKPHVKRGAKYLAPPFRRGLPWLGAAAVLLVGLLFLVTHFSRHAPQGPTKPADKITDSERKETALAEVQVQPSSVKEPAALTAKASGPEGYLSGAGGGAADRAAISEDIPFAPASAIELVTLPRREDVQITIYNSADLTLVRERRNLTLKKGWNWLQFMWTNTLIDPTSLSLEPLQEADKIDVQQLVFPPRLRELGRWLIRSQVSGQVPFEITYFTSGLAWRAFYMGTLSQDEKTMRLDGYVRVGNNSGEDYENAQTRLIVGKVHLLDQIAELAKRPYPYGMPIPLGGLGGYASGGFGGMRGAAITNGEPEAGLGYFWSDLGGGLRPKEIRKEGLSEYFLYTIEGTETIPDKWGKRLLSFEAKDIAVKSLYKYDEERWGEQTIRFVSFANDKKHNLGDTPIPNGTVRIYSQTDEQGYLSYVGGTDIKYIPVDEEVELNLGPARLVGVEPILMDFKTDNYVFDGKKNVAGWDQIRTWKVEVTNTRALPIDIEITRGFGTAYWALQLEDKDVSYEKYDAVHARFKLTLQPRSKHSFGYRVRTYHGTREEVLTKQREGSDYEQ
jgi:hypothetical protein